MSDENRMFFSPKASVNSRRRQKLFTGIPPVPYAERRVAVARGGGEVHALAVDVEDALLEYLQTVYHLGRARWALGRLGVLDFVTTIAPGLRDVFLTGRICQALQAPQSDGARYRS